MSEGAPEGCSDGIIDGVSEGPSSGGSPACTDVTVLEYNITREAKGGVLENRVAAGLPGKFAYNMPYTTDAVRLILLSKYGGLGWML